MQIFNIPERCIKVMINPSNTIHSLVNKSKKERATNSISNEQFFRSAYKTPKNKNTILNIYFLTVLFLNSL